MWRLELGLFRFLVVFKSLLQIHTFMGIVDLVSAINKSEQQFMALLTKTYQLFHPLSPPEFTVQFIWESKTLSSAMKAVTLCPK